MSAGHPDLSPVWEEVVDVPALAWWRGILILDVAFCTCRKTVRPAQWEGAGTGLRIAWLRKRCPDGGPLAPFLHLFPEEGRGEPRELLHEPVPVAQPFSAGSHAPEIVLGTTELKG